MKIFDVEISVYPNYLTADRSEVITLNTWFNSVKYRDKVLELRKCQEKELRDQMKATLPAITPSGLFSKRGKEFLIKHSGFIQFDIDSKENPGIDPQQWKKEIMKLGCAACQLSVSGQGLWGLFKIENPDKHIQHFNSLVDVFKYWGINIDPACSDVSRLRGYSYDPETLFNPDAVIFNKLKEKKLIAVNSTSRVKSTNKTDIEFCLEEIERRGIDITQHYNDWFALGCAIASEFGETGRQYFHTLSRHYPRYDPKETDKQYNNCLKGSGYTIATFFEYCKREGIKYTEKKISTENEIFCRLAKKNPALLKLRDEFDLTDKYGNEFSCS
jgi:hypothetical protein